MKLFTWLDVERVIRHETHMGMVFPRDVYRIDVFSDGVEIGGTISSIEMIKEYLVEWFGDWFDADSNEIALDIGDARLPVELVYEEADHRLNREIRPLWQYVGDLPFKSDVVKDKLPNLSPPRDWGSQTKFIAFHSFKGGVGRTTTLAAFLEAIIEHSDREQKSSKILVIDGDLEAPGLTFWGNMVTNESTVSYIDFLEAVQYPPTSRNDVVKFFASQLHKNSWNRGGSEIFFMPSCVSDAALLDMRIMPEHLAKGSSSSWLCSDAIMELGTQLGVDFILMDLRAGLSEISSPILFDPRIERIHVTTMSTQSVRGTALAIRKVMALHNLYEQLSAYYSATPRVLLTMLTPELRESNAYDSAIGELIEPLVLDDIDDVASAPNVIEAEFHSELLSVSSWDDAFAKLAGTTVLQRARDWINESVFYYPKVADYTEHMPKESLELLRDTCSSYEYAESGQSNDLLITEPLRNLAKQFYDSVPRVVSIGSKGAGKTFNYIQLCRFKKWGAFIERALGVNLGKGDSFVFPILQSRNLRDRGRALVSTAREIAIASLYSNKEYVVSDLEDRISCAGKNIGWSEGDWRAYWVSELAIALGIEQETTLSGINAYLKSIGKKIIFLFDGIEDAFRDIENSKTEQYAVSALLSLPDRLGELRDPAVGVVIFVRRDYVRYAIRQNRAQFENLYKSYDLSWDADSFLRLVAWICGVAGVQDLAIDGTSARHELVDALENIWGKKLGSDSSKEAYSANWVYAALTDFNGRLQARDDVRFLLYAAKVTLDEPKTVQFDYWQTTRLLPPAAIRRALDGCSEKKVEEAEEEYPEFARWVSDLGKYLPDQKRIPFTADKFELTQSRIELLREMGVLFDDRGKDDITRFYMPEIFRAGLGFSLDKGARPRVLVLKKKALGPDRVLFVD